MKFLALATSALLTSTACARSSGISVFGKGVDITPNIDSSLSVPGENPLQHCADPKDDILTLENVDLSPNPPKAYIGQVPV